MKKVFTFATMVALAVSASAQTESAFVDATALLGADASTTPVSVKAETEICKSASITMKAAWDDTYKIVSMCGADDAANKVIIDGVTYDMPTGIQGQSNPKPSDLMNGGQNSGAVFKFDVATDGVLYVFGKISGNKSYYVWEGDVANGNGMPVAFTMQVQPVGGGAPVGYTLPICDAEKLGYYEIGNGYDNGSAYADASWCVDIYKGLPSWGENVNPTNTWATTWTGGNALGVIAFPVYKEAKTYFVNACGSKITCNGFAFVPGATTVGTISFSKGEGSGISNITTDVENVNAPVYNLAGQRVSKDAKGIFIQNGKKFINK